MATVVAAPAAARYLADFGADVIKIEAPVGDPARRMGWRTTPGDDSYFWKILGRNKRCATVDLKTPDGLEHVKSLIDDADVLIENFRPGKLEKLGLDPVDLLDRNPRLVVLRITGFGQSGPYAARPGFATIAEALSGYSAISGEPDGGPLLPPIAITDEVTGIVGAFSVMIALWHARATGQGQVVDVNLIETLLQLMGPLIPARAHLGYEQPRLGSGLPWSVPRGTYRCADGRWIALSASADTVASRLLRVIGLGEDKRYATFAQRMLHREELEQYVAAWVGERTCDKVLQLLSDMDAAVAPVYSMAEVLADPHFCERECFVEIGGVVMPNVIARLSRTPGRIRHAGRPQSSEQSGWGTP
jgi:crotonobetainyl-CoA:carnitine CoA-transferase CaiB-like acyl-CoA transferase